MPPVSLGLGGFLILLGAIFFVVTGAEHYTALIASGFGVGFAILGGIGMTGESARKHAMHVAAMLALFGVLGGGIMAIKSLIVGTDKPLAMAEQAIMAVACAIFEVMCVRSFIAARKARAAGEE